MALLRVILNLCIHWAFQVEFWVEARLKCTHARLTTSVFTGRFRLSFGVEVRLKCTHARLTFSQMLILAEGGRLAK